MANFTLQQLTEGIKQRHVGVQNKRLMEKWTRTGLLRGLDDVNRENMSQLLENQASQLLREANTLGGDQVKGFTSIAFPIVRRVFGGLVANELVSIQPMSLPSGLLFYLDYTYGSNVGGASTDATATYKKGESIYNNPTGKDIQKGSFANGGQYDLTGSGFSKKHSSDAAVVSKVWSDGSFKSGDGNFATVLDTSSIADLKLIQFDNQIVDLIDAGGEYGAWTAVLVSASQTDMNDGSGNNAASSRGLDKTLIKDVALSGGANLAASKIVALTSTTVGTVVQSGSVKNLRRLNQLGTLDVNNQFVPNPFADLASAYVLCIIKLDALNTEIDTEDIDGADALTVSFIADEKIEIGSPAPETYVQPQFESDLGGDVTTTMGQTGIAPVIPEIDIKIESIPVTTTTRKLRARWSPELAQDLNAYHSLDAEVELTQILSEQIALEIDREILNDLLTQAQGANFFWSRAPGKFVNKRTGQEIARTSTLTPGPAFTGTVREWYETLTETIIDVANEIHRKTLRGSANFIVVSPDIATVLEASVLYRPSYSIDGDGQVAAPFTMGAEKIGSLSNRFTVYKDPYFPRNKILVGYKGGSYLETGFVYAPYVPLIVTPTIFAPEDFTPRKGVMTRYGKKMVRADFYGTVTCLDMNII
jgi:hypothetical protein